jgi:parallel beta-helix repeat protein
MKVTKIKNVLSFLLIGISVFMTMGSSYMQISPTKYVDGTNGSDSNNGLTASTAWKTIQKAVSNVQPGDTIIIRAGTYSENIVVSKTGTAGNVIRMANYPGETVIINGGTGIALRSSGSISYWTLEGLTIKSTNRYTLRLGWYGEPMTDHWTLKNNTIYGANYIMGSYHLWENNTIDGTGYPGTQGDAGISDGGDSNHNTYRYNTVKNFTNVDARGIWTQGKTHDTVIEYNTVDNIMATSGIGQCIDLDGAAQVEWRNTVRGNTVSNCNYVGIQLENVFDSLVENNIIKNSGPAGIIVINYDAGVKCLVGGENNQYGDTNGDNNCQGDITNDVIRQNVITTSTYWGWGYGGIMNWYAGGLIILGNTINAPSGSGNGGINFQGTAAQIKGASINDNIISQGKGVPICISDPSTLVEAQNNLFNRINSIKPYATGSSCDTEYTLVEFQTQTGHGQNSLLGDPAFKNAGAGDMRISASSSAIDKGMGIGTTTDADGNTRLVGLSEDIGAYEYGSVVPTATNIVTATSTASTTSTATSIASATPTATSIATATPTAINIATATPTATNIVTATPTATNIVTAIPTNTSVPITATATQAMSITPIVTNTTIPTAIPTATSTSPITAGVDVALKKIASQSSVYESAGANRAVDGNTDGIFADKSVSHTNTGAQRWWQVDLAASYSISNINIWNRTDCCTTRLSNFYVLVSDKPFSSTSLSTTLKQSGVSKYYVSGNAGKTTTLAINKTGRYVRVQLTGSTPLSLAEVQVMSIPTAITTQVPTSVKTNTPTTANTLTPTKTYTQTSTAISTSTPTPTVQIINTATPVAPTTIAPTQNDIDNVALGKEASQASLYEGNLPGRAVDGNTDGNLANNSVTHTQEGPQEWWQVDLGDNFSIQTINVWTRTDCCDWRLSNFYVMVSDQPFASTDLAATLNQSGVSNYYVTDSAGSPTPLTINRTGRYIRVQLTNRDALSLAEVQVMAYTKPATILSTISSPAQIPTATNLPQNTPTAKAQVPATAIPTATLEPSPTPTIQGTPIPVIVPTDTNNSTPTQ